MAIKIQDLPNRAAYDVQSAQDLRTQFAQDPQKGLKAAAQQFETLFMQQVLKSMRDTVSQDGLMNSDQSRFYTALLDQQMAQTLSTSGKGVGFARLIEQQLGRSMAVGDRDAQLSEVAKLAGNNALPLSTVQGQSLQYAAVPSKLPTSSSYAKAGAAIVGEAGAVATPPASSKEFVMRIWPHAVEASRSTGIPPQFLVAHSALESGWGKSEIRGPDGVSSFNLFGIKAGKNWSGKTVEATTTEYVDGQPRQVVERFRAYDSYEEAFRDYAAFLRNNTRYGSVIGSQDGAEFASRLQRAGYATDPAYADKLSRIINGPALRQALIG